MTWHIITADVLEGLAQLPDESVQTVITSPPYWGLRDYGTAEWEGGDQRHREDLPPHGPGHDAEGPTLLHLGHTHTPEEMCDHLQNNWAGRGVGTLHGNPTDDAAQAKRTPYKATCGKCGAVRKDQQLGLEPTPEAYVERIVEVFREVRRVLRRDGTCWLNLGDSYASGGTGGYSDKSTLQGFSNPETKGRVMNADPHPRPAPPGLKPKDLVGIPWRVAFALQADGWYLRSDVIWAKPNPMPESVTDRPTKAHEYVFLLTRSARYFYDSDAVREPMSETWRQPSRETLLAWREKQTAETTGRVLGRETNPNGGLATYDRENAAGRNLRSVWSIPTEPFPQAHFATFPKNLVVPCIKAGTSEKGACPECGAAWVRVTSGEASEPQRNSYHGQGVVPVHRGGGDRPGGYYPERTTTGWRSSCTCIQPGDYETQPVPCIVLDPFAGSGTVGVVALRYGRSFVGIELNPEYAEMARNRIRDDGPLFNVAEEVAP